MLLWVSYVIPVRKKSDLLRYHQRKEKPSTLKCYFDEKLRVLKSCVRIERNTKLLHEKQNCPRNMCEHQIIRKNQVIQRLRNQLFMTWSIGSSHFSLITRLSTNKFRMLEKLKLNHQNQINPCRSTS